MTPMHKEQLNCYVSQIEGYLEQCIVYPEEPQQKLFDAMRYSLLAGGKRLRPVLLLEFCRLCGGQNEEALPFAAAVEMIHTYSLIHDDLPCMDDDDFRRGYPTNHKVYGEAIAVLAGDGLLTSAFSQITAANLDWEIKGRGVQVLAQCAGEIGMVGGQVLDIMSEERQCTEEEVLAIQSRKTGALIRAACVLGALAGKGTGTQLQAAAAFADNLGLAFQIRDDMLDVIGTAEAMGKSVGTDADKNTFVQLYGLEKCEQLVAQYTANAIEALSQFQDTDFLVDLAHALTDRFH